MGCGASKVSNQAISPVENDISKVTNSKAINNEITSSSTSIPITPKTSNSISNNDSKNESITDNGNITLNTSSSNAKEKEVPKPLRKSSSDTLGLDNSKFNSKSLFKSKSRSSLLEPTNKKTDININSKSNSSSYLKKKENSSKNLLNNKYGNEKKGLSQSSSEATLTNQNSSDSIVKLSLTSSFVPLPAIESRTTLKSISFEIPLDDCMKCKTIRPSFKGSLPKLHISQDEIKRKLGNVDSKWKDINVTKNGYKKKGPVDEERLKALKKRLLEKEAEAALNRQRELDKLKAKLEKAQKHALKVQERKRKLEAEWMSKSKNNLEMPSNIDYIS